MTDEENGTEGGETSLPDAPQPEGDPRIMDLPAIAELRSTNKKMYYSQAVQSRELELIEEQGPVEDSSKRLWFDDGQQEAPQEQERPWWQDGQHDAQADAEYDAGQELIAVEDLPADMQPAREFADAVLEGDAMGDDTLESFTSELTATAQDALVAEMSRPPDMDAEPATEAQLQAFEATDAGLEMSGEWGDEAAAKLGVIRARYNRLRNNLPEHERPVFDELFDSLPPAAVEQVYRRLAG